MAIRERANLAPGVERSRPLKSVLNCDFVGHGTSGLSGTRGLCASATARFSKLGSCVACHLWNSSHACSLGLREPEGRCLIVTVLCLTAEKCVGM
jgi:hypothetical protein